MADEMPSATATLPEDRDAAMKALWQHVFGTDAASGTQDGATDSRLGRIDSRLDQVETRLDRVETRLERVDDRLGRVDTRLAVVETKMTMLEAAVSRLDAAIVRLRENARPDFRLTFGAVIATALGLAGMMAKGFHWI